MLDYREFLKLMDNDVGYEVNIDYRPDDPVIDKLIDVVQRIKSTTPNGNDAKELKNELATIIKNRFGINLKVDRGNFACLPLAAYDNVLSDITKDDIVQYAKLDKDVAKYIDKVEKLKKLNFEVDLEQVRIIGIPDDIKAYLFIPDELFYGGEYSKILSDREAVAVILHEIGHIFTFLYYMSRTVKNSVVLVDSFMLYSNGNTEKAKKVLVQNTTNKPIKTDDDKLVIRSVLDEMSSNLKAMGNYIVNLEPKKNVSFESEAEADSFAVRFGLAKELATSLDKIMEDKSSIVGLMKLGFGIFMAVLIFSLIRFVLTLYIVILMAPVTGVGASGLVGAILLEAFLFLIKYSLVISIAVIGFIFIISSIAAVVNILTGGDVDFEYEKLHNRIARMKRELIKVMRQQNLDKDLRKRLISEIEEVEKVMNKLIGDDRTASFLNNLIPNGNYGRDFDIKYITDLIIDKLQNNDLHYLSEKLNLRISK